MARAAFKIVAMRFFVGATVLCLTGAACGLEVSSDFPPTAVQFAAPQMFRAWWQVVEGCSARRRPFDTVSWYRVRPGELTIRGATAAGAWFVHGNRIVLTDWALRAGSLVRHEMLHALLETGSHPAEFFQEKCGDEVACGRECGAEQRLPDAQPLALEQLETTVALFPAAPSILGHEGRVTIAVSVRNTATGSGYVTAERFSQAQCPVGFIVESADVPFWRKVACEYLPSADDARVYFRPGERRRMLFDVDLRRPTTGSLRSGPITVSAILGDNIRQSITTTVLP